MDKKSILKSLIYLGFLLQLFTQDSCAENDLCECTEADQFNFVLISNVMENAPLGSVIEKFTFEGGAKIEVKSEISNPFVEFDSSTFELKVLTNFKVTINNPFVINGIEIVCTILENNQEIRYQVLVEVQDTNDHFPVFSDEPYIFNISELNPAGLALTPDITANDLDPRDVGHLTYSIVNDSPYSEYFNFTIPSKGRLVLQKQLNYQIVQRILLTIQVKDNSYNYSIFGTYQSQHVSSTTVIINILPILADMPSFVKQSYNIDLDENYDMSKEITIDSSWKEHIRDGYIFSLVKDPIIVDWQSFTIDASGGSLKPLNELKKSQYLLQLQVRKDSKSLFTTTLLQIRRVLRVRFSQRIYNTTLHNSTKTGSQLAVLQLTTNSKQCGASSYELKIMESDKNKKYLKITSDGRVILAKKLSLSLPSSFETKILLYSNLKTVDTAYLNVTITQERMSVLGFSQKIYEFSYYNNTYIGNVEVFNPFPDNLFSYNLISKNKKLTIDSHGDLRCAQGDCGLHVSPLMLTLHTNNTLIDSALVVLNPQNHPQFSRFETSPVNYKAAFIVAILLACLLLFVILGFVIFLRLLYKRKSEEFEHHFNNISTTFSEESSDPFAHDRKLSKLDKLQGILCNAANDSVNHKDPKENSMERIQAEIHNKETLPIITSDLKNDPVAFINQNISDSSNLTRTDVNTSQDTINASIMTLTRPAVGTNGITVYY